MSDEGANHRGFAGLRVAAFESRRAPEMARLIERAGGRPHVSPSMREVPIAENREAIDFANRVITGQIDIIIFMTGVGIRHLLAAIERHVDRERFLAAVSDATTVARGSQAGRRAQGIWPRAVDSRARAQYLAEVLATIDGRLPVTQQNVGLQEYGKPNASLVAGLEARGARAGHSRVSLGPAGGLRSAGGQRPGDRRRRRDAALFTSSHQVVNLFRVAEDLGLVDRLRAASRGWRSARSVPPRAKPCTSSTCRSTWNPSTARWASWWPWLPSGREVLAAKRALRRQPVGS